MEFIRVEPHIWVANMVAQHGIKAGSSGPPIRYEALSDCLSELGSRAIVLNASVHLPRIGCGLAGGKWELVEPLIEQHLCQNGVEVTVYDFN